MPTPPRASLLAVALSLPIACRGDDPTDKAPADTGDTDSGADDTGADAPTPGAVPLDIDARLDARLQFIAGYTLAGEEGWAPGDPGVYQQFGAYGRAEGWREGDWTAIERCIAMNIAPPAMDVELGDALPFSIGALTGDALRYDSRRSGPQYIWFPEGDEAQPAVGAQLRTLDLDGPTLPAPVQLAAAWDWSAQRATLAEDGALRFAWQPGDDPAAIIEVLVIVDGALRDDSAAYVAGLFACALTDDGQADITGFEVFATPESAVQSISISRRNDLALDHPTFGTTLMQVRAATNLPTSGAAAARTTGPGPAALDVARRGARQLRD